MHAVGEDEPFAGLRRYAHMLGFGGHFATKSRRYSTTLGALRQARRVFAAAVRVSGVEPEQLASEHSAESMLTLSSWRYDGTGWLTTGDAALALQAADAARARTPAGTTN